MINNNEVELLNPEPSKANSHARYTVWLFCTILGFMILCVGNAAQTKRENAMFSQNCKQSGGVANITVVNDETVRTCSQAKQ